MNNKHILEQAVQNAKQYGSFKESILQHAEDYGIENIDMLFPDYKKLDDKPQYIRRLTEWVDYFFKNVSRTPFAKIKSLFADIREDEARAKGYITGNRKKEEVFPLLKRTTAPTTVYKKQKLDRDDLTDITDMNVVTWMQAEMKMMLMEEIARACLLGDGRSAYSEDKINEECIRPILYDDGLFVIKERMNEEIFIDDDKCARYFVHEFIKMQNRYRGSGKLTLFINRELLVKLLLAEDKIGRRLYSGVKELGTVLGVEAIVPVELFSQSIPRNDIFTTPLAIALDLNDYNIGTNRGGEISSFEDFDIDYNQQKYLIETRCSGALTKPFSALCMVLESEDKELAGIEITKKPNKLNYKVGESFDPIGLIVSAIYVDGYKSPIQDYQISGFDSTTEGVKVITVTYEGKTATFEIYVSNKRPMKIEVTHLPYKSLYHIGESFDDTGLVISLVYDDMTKIPVDDYELTGFDSSTAGEKIITVKYNEFTTIFGVMVTQAAPIKIQVRQRPYITTYYIGATFNPEGLIVMLIYDDQTEEEIFDYQLSGFDSSTPGVKTITVSYNGFMDTFPVTILEPQFEFIRITHQPYKTIYRTGSDETLNLFGLEISAHYSSGMDVPMSLDNFIFSDFNTEETKTWTITATYKGDPNMKDSFTVMVEELNPDTFTLTTPPQKTTYFVGEELDTTGLLYHGTWHGHPSYILPEDCEFGGYDMTMAGKYKVYAQYKYTINDELKTATFDITVKTPGVTPINNERELYEYLTNPDEGTTGALEANIRLSDAYQQWLMEGNKDRVLDLNGHILDLNDHNFGVSFDTDDTLFSVIDLSDDGNGTVQNGSDHLYADYKAGFVHVLKGHLNFNGGIYTKCGAFTNETDRAGLARIDQGQISVYSGEFVNNQTIRGASVIYFDATHVSSLFFGGEFHGNTVKGDQNNPYRYGAIQWSSGGTATKNPWFGGTFNAYSNSCYHYQPNTTSLTTINVLLDDTNAQYISLAAGWFDNEWNMYIHFVSGVLEPKGRTYRVATGLHFDMSQHFQLGAYGDRMTVYEDDRTHAVMVKVNE